METITLPKKIQFKAGDEPNHSQLVIEPCYSGYGTTLGNALRRVLLSSLPGAAVTAVKIKGVSHEFSTVPHVKEDIVDIILNLKQLRLKLFSDEPVKLLLKVKGEKKATAGDIEKSAQAEIVNKDLLIATLADKEAELEMELTVAKGLGYLPVESRGKEVLEAGAIAVDAIFTPMRNVSLKIENVRVGQMTNFDKLIMDIETDGTVTPKDAVEQAVKILIDHFGLIVDLDKANKASEEAEQKEIAEEAAMAEEAEMAKVPEPAAEEKQEAENDSAKAGQEEQPKKKRGRPRKNPAQE